MRLIIGNSMSRLEGLDANQLKAIRKLTSYSIDPKSAYFSGSSYNLTRNLMDKRGSFPTGLLYIVQKWLINTPGVTVIDNRRTPMPRQGLFALTMPHAPYQEQIEAAEACKREYRGIVSATTGTGKSFMMALAVNLLQVPTLIVVPSLELKRQLTNDMVDWFGKERVGGLGESLAIENVDALDPKKPLKGYDCVIIEEFHHSAAKTYQELNRKAWNDVFYRFGFTATPFRSQDHERLLLEAVLSKVIYRLTYRAAVEKGYIVPVEAYYIELPKRKTEAYTWPQVYSELVVNNKDRNRIISNLLQDCGEAGKKTLCLVKEIKHGQNLLKDRPLVPFVSGDDMGSRAWLDHFKEGKVDVLIGTNGILGEGVDTKPAEFVIIAGLGKSKNQFMQQIGRGLRKYPGKESCKIILFKDPSHKFTLTHFRTQVKILKEEYDIQIEKIGVST